MYPEASPITNACLSAENFACAFPPNCKKKKNVADTNTINKIIPSALRNAKCQLLTRLAYLIRIKLDLKVGTVVKKFVNIRTK